MALIRHQPCLSPERLWNGPERSAEAAFAICVRLEPHALQGQNTPPNSPGYSTHQRKCGKHKYSNSVISKQPFSDACCVYGLCFLVLQTWGHCASQGQAACPVRPSLTARLGGGPMEASRPCARFYLARSLIFTPPSGSDLVAHSSPGLGPLGSSSISWRHFVTRHLCRVLQLKTQALFE